MSDTLVLSVSDQAELRPLREWLAEVPDVRVRPGVRHSGAG